MRIRTILIVVVVVLVALVATAVGIIMSIDFNQYKPQIAAAIADECFAWLDAPVKRVASTDTFVGYAPQLEDATLPQVSSFVRAYEEIAAF